MDLKLDHWGRSRAKLTKNSFVGRSFFWNRYSIPVSPLFLVHIMGVYKWSAHSCMPLGTSCSMYCTTPGACRNGGKYLHLLVWGIVLYCASQNVTVLHNQLPIKELFFELHFCKNVQIQIHISIFGIISFTYFYK